MERNWRLIIDGACPAASNMAIDEAILMACLSGEAPPTLRLYRWRKPAISLGFFQDLYRAHMDIEYCQDAGIELVRRPTGGRAVLHGHDLTFSVILGIQHLPESASDILGSHRWLMSGIVAGLQSLGIQAQIGEVISGTRPGMPSADCFAHTAECDIHVGQEKIAGAAQVRRNDFLLEQGSIPCRAPLVDPGKVFRGRNPNPPDLLSDIPAGDIENAIVTGFRDDLSVEFTEGVLSEYENDIVSKLENDKYSLADWTFRRSTVRIDNSFCGCYTNSESLRGGRYHAEENPRR